MIITFDNVVVKKIDKVLVDTANATVRVEENRVIISNEDEVFVILATPKGLTINTQIISKKKS